MWEKTRGREGLHQGLVAFCFQGEVSDHLKCPRLVVSMFALLKASAGSELDYPVGHQTCSNGICMPDRTLHAYNIGRKWKSADSECARNGCGSLLVLAGRISFVTMTHQHGPLGDWYSVQRRNRTSSLACLLQNRPRHNRRHADLKPLYSKRCQLQSVSSCSCT